MKPSCRFYYFLLNLNSIVFGNVHVPLEMKPLHVVLTEGVAITLLVVKASHTITFPSWDKTSLRQLEKANVFMLQQHHEQNVWPVRSWRSSACLYTSPCTGLCSHGPSEFCGSSWQTDPELPLSPPPDALNTHTHIYTVCALN